MTPFAHRLLFFAAGLGFGVVVGWLLGGEAEAPGAPPRTPGVPTAGGAATGVRPAPPLGAAAPASEAQPLDEARLEGLLAEVEARPEDPQARAAVGRLYLDARRFRDAAYWLRQAKSLDASDHGLRATLAFALLAGGDVSAAISEYEMVLAEDSEHLETLLGLGRLRLYVEQDIAGGIALWERFVAAAPEAPEAAAVREAIDAIRAAHPG